MTTVTSFWMKSLGLLAIAGLLSISLPAAPRAQAAMSIRGASFIPSSTTTFSTDSFRQSLRNFQADGGNTANFIIPLYQSNSGSTDINPGWNTPTDDSLGAWID